ncbi:MAG: hypothetical protein Q9178_003038 [Gyalolechia marmorata]
MSRSHDLSGNNGQTQDEKANHVDSLLFRNLSIHGSATLEHYQTTFLDYPLSVLARLVRHVFGSSQDRKVRILQDFEGVIVGGEMLLALGRPGSGCTTLLKTLSGDSRGLHLDTTSLLSYQGVPMAEITKRSRGEYIYVPESDIHFPHLTVAQTLTFASQARTASTTASSSGHPYTTTGNTEETITALALTHALHTKVGSSVVKGISGGERKRTSIAEILVGTSRIQCWDNSIRGLDSANALRFIECIHSSAVKAHIVVIATLYQASEAIYNCFDKVIVLYEGREIYFGSTNNAKAYFIDLGFICPDRSTTADFLCSITNPSERIIRQGREDSVPLSPAELAKTWLSSSERVRLVAEIQKHENVLASDYRTQQSPRSHLESTMQRPPTPYILPFSKQVNICLTRSFQRLAQEPTPVISGIIGNTIISIILGSMFYNMPANTSSFFGRGVLLFFTILTNTLLASFEGVQLWDHRPIVEKQYQLAFYHRSAEAVASMLCDLPNKVLLTAGFNLPFYFMANMRRTPAAFFTFYFFAFISLLTGSMLYRTIGAMSRTLTASIAPGSVFILLLVIYTGFILPIPSMHPWLRWFAYINPVGYAFESLMINEFQGLQFPCVSFIPEGPSFVGNRPHQRMCSVTGATAGSDVVDGSLYLATTFDYHEKHLWRNLAVLFGIMTLLCILYLVATECLAVQRSRGEVLIHKRTRQPKTAFFDDSEKQEHATTMPRVTQPELDNNLIPDPKSNGPVAASFIWDNLSYEINVSKLGRLRLLDDIEGWVEPGTLTALMGESGAGKTTLLNVLAMRADVGVISGEKLVDSRFQNEGFARKIGYAQQEDIALSTATVKEALVFSARLRQSSQYTDAEKLAYVEEVISMLDLGELANAVIGAPGDGLNIEQRKRLTIGIELAARPELLLFLDEPTSGMDSNTAWTICRLLRRLADAGQTILCTIHQPSGTIFEMFDRLLLIQHGRSLYFGNIGQNSRIVIDYFSQQGVATCPPQANPAEWLMTITSLANSSVKKDWPQLWASSAERRAIKARLAERKAELRAAEKKDSNPTVDSAYAAPFLRQLYHVTKRNFEQDWRTPSYLHSKLFLALGASIVNGFSFYASSNSLQGTQNQIFSVFILFTLHSSLVQLIIPRFLENRRLYELDEGPSRTYRWDVFVLSNIISELPSQTVLATVQYLGWFYPIGMYRNAISAHALNERSGLMFLLLWSYMLFSSTFSQIVATITPDAATGINISSLLYSLSLIFCG